MEGGIKTTLCICIILRLLGIICRGAQNITSFAADMGLEVNNREHVTNSNCSPAPVLLALCKATVPIWP